MRHARRIWYASLAASLLLNTAVMLWLGTLRWSAVRPAHSHPPLHVKLVLLHQPQRPPAPHIPHPRPRLRPLPERHPAVSPRPIRPPKTRANELPPAAEPHRIKRYHPAAGRLSRARRGGSALSGGAPGASATPRAAASAGSSAAAFPGTVSGPALLAQRTDSHPEARTGALPLLTAPGADSPTAPEVALPVPGRAAGGAALPGLVMGAADAAPGTSAGGSGSGSGSGHGQGAGEGRGTGAGSGTGSGAGAVSGSGGLFGMGSGLGAGEGPRHIVYLIDVSPSMVTRIGRAKEELRGALATLQPGESFDVLAFSADCRPFSHSLVPADPAGISRAVRFVDSLTLSPATNLERALKQALSLRGVNVVVVITDGVPTLGETDFGKLARRARELNVAHARIFTIGLVGKDPNGQDESFQAAQLLRQIAADSGGASWLVSLGAATPD